MSWGNTVLYVVTAIWIFSAWFYVLPVLSMPVARIKRELAFSLLGMGSIAILVEWLTKRDMQLVSIISLSSFLIIALVTIHLLRRMDYYVEEILQELFVLSICSTGVSIMSSIWYWGIDGGVSLLALRIVEVVIPLVLFGVSWIIMKQHYSGWSALVFLLLMAVKWIAVPYWTIWSVIVVLLYSTLVGYVANWMTTTTYAEKVLAWNISPSKIWSLLVLSAGALVLFF